MDVLVNSIVTRAKRTQQRGERVRMDDNPEVFKTRLGAHRTQTPPPIDYYRSKGTQTSIDGVNEIDTMRARLDAAMGA